MEHNNENNSSGQQAPRMVNNFQGAVIHNMVINNGTLTQHLSGSKEQQEHTDEQVARALMAVVGEGKPIDTKQKWAGAYWWLRWDANFPVDIIRFCERVKKLPGAAGLEVVCEYNNIRRTCALPFMNCDPRQMDNVRVSNADREAFVTCREVALALAGALAREKNAKTAPPK